MSNRMRRFWRALGVGLVAVGCLFVAGQGGATAAPGDDDHKDNPGEISKNPKFPANDGPQPTAAQAELAERIAAIETNDSRDVPTDNGLPYQVLQGFVGMTVSPTGGYTASLAEGVSSKAATSSAFAGLSADALGSLTLKESDVSVDVITSVWDAFASF